MQFTLGLHRAVQQNPGSTATVCGSRRRTYRELTERVSRLAGGLRETGVKAGDRVCIYALNSDRYLESYLAIAWLGAVVNPANFRWSADEVAYSINDSNCRAIIVDDQFAPGIPAIQAQCQGLQTVIFAGDEEKPEAAIDYEELIASSQAVEDVGAHGDDLFGIFYTGGTTGKPKGVMLAHRNLGASGLSLLAEGVLAGRAVGLHAAPMFHLADMMLTTCLVQRGGTHVFLPAFHPAAVLDLVEKEGITDLLLVPAMLQAVVDFPGCAERKTDSVQRVLYGASPASQTLLERVMQNIPTAGLYQVYGMTEMAAVITVLTPEAHDPEKGKLRSGGRSGLHVEVRVADDDGKPVATGTVGEILARGPGQMLGYFNKPEATIDALRNGWMHTGDMGRLDEEGYLYIVDRKKDMIITGGENVYSAEVENAIASHPAVATSAVIGIPCPDMGEKVHAAVVLKPDAQLTQEDLYAHCKQKIAGYKCPRSLALVDALPMSGAGKVLKTELRKPYWSDQERGVN